MQLSASAEIVTVSCVYAAQIQSVSASLDISDPYGTIELSASSLKNAGTTLFKLYEENLRRDLSRNRPRHIHSTGLPGLAELEMKRNMG